MIMYYLAKFCRICIQTGGKLTDIEATDYDSVRFSEKLKACTQMEITRESLSTQICSSCVHKLRISYQFQDMCKKSTTILQRYLTELLSMSDNVSPDQFMLSELHIAISTALPKPRRKRVGKDERCSLLKKLLSKITQEQMVHNIHINGLAKLCDRIPPPVSDKPTHPPQLPHATGQKSEVERPDVEILPLLKTDTLDRSPQQNKCQSGGLRNLLNFTRSFDFGYDITSAAHNHNNFDLTPIERLAKFTESFFCDHFLDYRETIIHITDGLEPDSSDDEQMFEKCDEEAALHMKSEVVIKEEIVIVEPDVNLKKEQFYEEQEDPTYDDEETDLTSDYEFTSRFVQACYDNSEEIIKSECPNDLQDQVSDANYVAQNRRLAEIIPITVPGPTQLQQNYLQQPPFTASASHNFLTQGSLHTGFLKQMEDPSVDCFKRHRTLSPYSVKCRTRGNPFINPQLKKQFQTRNFKCSSCSRRFKSPGYLKAHCSRLKH